MNPSFRERLREIITDCVITGYENANKLIDKTEAEILSLVKESREPLIDAALAYHHAKDREESKRLKLKFIEACANYEHGLNEIGEGDEK